MKRISPHSPIAFVGLAGLSLMAAAVAIADSNSATHRDWPLWSGPDRNLTSLGNGVFEHKSFGLAKVWSRPLGSAYSGIAVVGEHVITGFSDGESDYLVSLAAGDGKEQWRYRISKTYAGHDGSDDGPLATPMIAGGMVYGFGAWGNLFALNLADGKEIWSHQVVEKFGGRKPEYGFTTTPTVAGDLLVAEIGGDAGRSIAAFDRRTGELRWSIGDDTVAYQSPLVLRSGDKTQILAVTNNFMFGLEPESGKILWQHQHDKDAFDGHSQPVPVGEDGVLLTYWNEAVLFRLEYPEGQGVAASTGVQEVWRSNALRGNYAIPAPYEGHLYGFSGRFLTCIDAATGEAVWKSRPPGGGNLVLVDGHLVIQAPSGEVVVAEATAEGYVEKARVQALERGSYTRPSFAGGRVFLRDLTDIAAVSVTEAPAAASEDEG
ncbi:MAG: PQQ-binding-like beta-propeller repeat protein [Acidobacteriota bacterium]